MEITDRGRASGHARWLSCSEFASYATIVCPPHSIEVRERGRGNGRKSCGGHQEPERGQRLSVCLLLLKAKENTMLHPWVLTLDEVGERKTSQRTLLLRNVSLDTEISSAPIRAGIGPLVSSCRCCCAVPHAWWCALDSRVCVGCWVLTTAARCGSQTK